MPVYEGLQESRVPHLRAAPFTAIRWEAASSRIGARCDILRYIPRRRPPMPRTAKLFTNGRSQAVRLPADLRFEGTEVFIRQDPATGDVILSRRPESWDE